MTTSCGGAHCSRWLTSGPTSKDLQLSNDIFQCLMRRRLGMPIVTDQEQCKARSCHHRLDAYGHHLTTCMCSGIAHGRHSMCIRVWRRILEEAGYRVRVERTLADTHLRVPTNDRRRMDLVASPKARGTTACRGLPLFCDITIVRPLSGQSRNRDNAYSNDGCIVENAARIKRRHYSDVISSGTSVLVVLGCESYGR